MLPPSEPTSPFSQGEEERFFSAYIYAALWSSVTDDGDPLEYDHDRGNFSHQTIQEMKMDCLAFMGACSKFITRTNYLLVDCFYQAGHDFWLTRNGHGSGFWDGDWTEYEFMHDKCKEFGCYDLEVDDDGIIHGYGRMTLFRFPPPVEDPNDFRVLADPLW